MNPKYYSLYKSQSILAGCAVRTFVIAILFNGVMLSAFAQSVKPVDTMMTHKNTFLVSAKDTLLEKKDSLINALKSFPGVFKSNVQNQRLVTKQRIGNSLKKIKPDSSVLKSSVSGYSFKNILSSKPLIKFSGGYIAYNMNYRSNIDTPLVEKNIMQNNVNGSLNFAIANIPLRTNFLLRRSNSIYFRDINDVQVEFDAASYKNMLQSSLRQRLLALVPRLRDSLLELDYKVKLKAVGSLHDWLNDPEILRKLFGYKEIMSIQENKSNNNIDSSENNRIAKLKKEGEIFIKEYDQQQQAWENLNGKKDSVERLYHKMQENILKYKDFIQNKLGKLKNAGQLEDEIKDFGLKDVKIPANYQRLMNVRRFGLGRNQLNYSELTSKNVNLTGLNFEYNSWYYIALAAGTIDYRFRDFVVNKLNKSPQFIYLARLGLGKIEGNHFIVTAYKGQKQIFASGTAPGLQSIDILGFSAEVKLKLALNSYLIGEAAESLSPDFRITPLVTSKFDFKDESNKALSLKFYSYFPKTSSRIEAMYKYTGANFQSFSSFQTNSMVKAWNVKIDQSFFKRKLKVSGSIKSNDFSNPYIVQDYKSNTVFKSIQATFRSRNLPMITIGFIPMSQLTYVDSTLTENHFQSFNASITHFYKLGERKATSSFIYNRFYNTLSDTSFAYYNAGNIYFMQSVDFLLYTMNLALSHSKSPGFELNVFDANIKVRAGKYGSVGFGVKVNDFDRLIDNTGTYGSLQLNIGKLGVIRATYDNGYLPASNHRFLRSNQMNLNFIKQLH